MSVKQMSFVLVFSIVYNNCSKPCVRVIRVKASHKSAEVKALKQSV